MENIPTIPKNSKNFNSTFYKDERTQRSKNSGESLESSSRQKTSSFRHHHVRPSRSRADRGTNKGPLPSPPIPLNSILVTVLRSPWSSASIIEEAAARLASGGLRAGSCFVIMIFFIKCRSRQRFNGFLGLISRCAQDERFPRA